MKQHMNNFLISISFLLITAFFAIGCAEAQNKKANKLYVEASMEASQFLDKAWDHNYSKLNDTYRSAKEKIDTILSKYPSSDIAVGLISEQIKISGLTVKQFMAKESIVKQMKDSEESPLSCAQLIMETIDDKKEKARMFFSMATLYARVGLKDKVRFFLSEAFEVANNSISMDDKSDALFVIAKTYAEFGYLENALEVAESIDNPNDRIRAFVEIICEHADSMGKEFTVQMLPKAIDVAKDSDEYKNYYFEDIVDKYIDLGLLDQSFDVVNLIDDDNILLQTLNLIKIAEEYLKTDQKEKVMTCLSQALKNSNGSLESISIAKIYGEVGETQKADELLSQAVEDAKEAYGFGKARRLGSIATQYANIGQYKKADQIFSRALEAIESIGNDSTAMEAASYIVCERADVLKTEHAIQLLLKTIEMIEPLRQENYLYSSHLMRIASKLSDLGQFEKVFKIIKYDKFLNTSHTQPNLQSNISINFIDHGRMDQAFELFQIRDSGTAHSLFLGYIFENYSDHKYTEQIERLFVKLLEVSETASIEQYWLTGLDILGYYSKASLKEQELKLASTIFKKVQERAGEDFIVEGLAEIAVIHAKIGTDDQIANVLSAMLETAHNTNKNINKVALLTVAASIYDKTRLNPNRRNKLVLHNIVSAIDPLSNL
jgi:tetratricopeptide (TPR) repeat protein